MLLENIEKLASLGYPLLFAFAYAFALSFVYKMFSRDISDREKFSAILIFMAVTTAMIISVIKGSLALSIGLIGALSIVRFRSPIKDPEQLVYIFIAIAIGIGIGAGELQFTGVATGFLCLLIVLFSGIRGGGAQAKGRENANIVARIAMIESQPIDIDAVSQFLNGNRLSHTIKGVTNGPEETSITVHFHDTPVAEVNSALSGMQQEGEVFASGITFELWNITASSVTD